MNLENWKNIAESVGALSTNGEECSSSIMANKAIEIILGENNLREAVHYYIEGKPGSELLRGVLWQLHPWSAMDECYTIFKTNPDIQFKRYAIELLRVVADQRVLPWIPEFLKHEDSQVQQWGVGVIDQLFFSSLCDEEEIAETLDIALQHENQFVREKAEEIKSMVESTIERNDIIDEHFNKKHNK